MIDGPGRAQARFPAAAEALVRKALEIAISNLAWATKGSTIGIAGAASGGDLLFHEICRGRGIHTRVLLGLPPEQFETESVAPAGPDWVRRYRELLGSSEGYSVMTEDDGRLEIPAVNVWHRANQWMLEQSLALAGEQALVALWDGKTGDGPGGTEHFLEVARRFGVRILDPVRIDALVSASPRR